MWISNIKEETKELSVAIPLTNGTGKTRIKCRGHFNEYGTPVATKTKEFNKTIDRGIALLKDTKSDLLLIQAKLQNMKLMLKIPTK